MRADNEGRDMTDGQCYLCGETYTKRGMNRHLRSCLPASEGETDSVVLRISGTHRDDYWIHTLVDQATTLVTMDSFLRDFWVECCGHLSTFQIGSVDYNNDNPGSPTSEPQRGQSMDVSLGAVLDRHTVEEFSYVYDWGSSTHLTLSVVETGRWDLSTLNSDSEEDVSTEYEGLLLLTRNDQPTRECTSCSEPAEQICQECLMRRGPDAFYCQACADDHDCAHPRFLPVVNSPRSGVCGYMG
jgi:hypothetical protein